MKQTSHLLKRVETDCSLCEDERRALLHLENTAEDVRRRQALINAGEPPRGLFILRIGWALVRFTSGEELTQITRVHYPGDVVGLCEMGLASARQTHQMLTDGSVAFVSYDRLFATFDMFPNLRNIFFGFAAHDMQYERDLAFWMGKLPARQRLISFLLAMHDRLRSLSLASETKVTLPLNQVEIALHLGLSSVHVSRVFARLQIEGAIHTKGKTVTFKDRASLEAEVDFCPERFDLSRLYSVQDNSRHAINLNSDNAS